VTALASVRDLTGVGDTNHSLRAVWKRKRAAVAAPMKTDTLERVAQRESRRIAMKVAGRDHAGV